MRSFCSVSDCQKPAKKRGWCISHYVRWQRHGDPLGGGPAWGEVRRFFEDVVLTYSGDDCLIWPYAKVPKGYGKIGRGGKTFLVHRLVCEADHGPPPSPDHESAHSCGRGHAGCVSRLHLSWKTKADNAADKKVHGTHRRGETQNGAKLTKSDVLAIRAMQGQLRQRELASKFGISDTTVRNIQIRKTWAWL